MDWEMFFAENNIQSPKNMIYELFDNGSSKDF